ncbi:MAG: SAM hydrolase/SAM-dependent halogenase family protein [Anaerovoracaceae bacterium]
MKPILVFQTDFTYKEGAVSAMYGVVKTVDRELEIMDGSHELPQYDIWSASYRLYQSMRFWPKGTIFVSVVDPGVGTARKACVAKTQDGYYVVTPDNGALTHLAAWVGIEEVREIDETINRLHGMGTDEVSVFHGRDLFGYCGARLASGIISYQQVGPSYPVEEIITMNISEPEFDKENGIVKGIFEINDPNFGNMWTNIPIKKFQEFGFKYGDKIRVKISAIDNKVLFDEDVEFYQSFGFVAKGEPIIYNNEIMKLGLALSQENFAEKYGIGFGPDWKIKFYL